MLVSKFASLSDDGCEVRRATRAPWGGRDSAVNALPPRGCRPLRRIAVFFQPDADRIAPASKVGPSPPLLLRKLLSCCSARICRPAVERSCVVEFRARAPARSQTRPRTFVRWHRSSSAAGADPRAARTRSRVHRRRFPLSSAAGADPRGAKTGRPPTQISLWSPMCSYAPSREPCSATRWWFSIRGTHTRGAPFCRTSAATGPRIRSRVAP